MMDDILYKLDRVSHFYGDKKVLDIEQLAIKTGSITGLSGPNGSGKSTLLKLLAFAMKPSKGEIRFNNQVEVPLSPRIRSKVTLLTQKPYLLKRSVFDNVIYGLKIRKDTTNLKQRAARALEQVGLDYDDFHNRYWHELSGGEAQRVAMAARLILKPKALLLDEPVASVDSKSAQLIRKASLWAKDEWGCTLVIVSHDLAWLHECSDTRISMAGGSIFSTGEESIIPPPYTEKAKNRVIKDLGNNEAINLSQRTGSTAVITQDRITLSRSKKQGNGYGNQVTAQVTQMLLEQKTGEILTTLAMDNFTLTLSLSPDQISNLELQPGMDIILMFNTKDIAWR
ncbi:MAG: ATP-binding cassette domain-containing protein [Desulfobacterales bacterium]|nr:ATP-binding cassette domain-containing protein [Desulfobacterales bacterium]